ncbi:MAG: glycoside hydrolase family 125 protein [Chloroflexi bacterium]|nr:glycoside hydrolase family 125 protein [Chloroflexota bacterium]
MTRLDHAFLTVEIDGARPVLEPSDAGATPAWSGHGVRVEMLAASDADRIFQRWHVDAGSGTAPRVEIRVRGRLDRPALAEITETDRPTPTGARSRWRSHDGRLHLEARTLPARADVAVRGATVRWTEVDGGELVGRADWPDRRDALALEIEVALGGAGAQADPSPVGAATGDRLTRGALAYVRGCTALRTGVDERTILTDHRILPLSWTRDAYWQAAALLAADGPGDRARVADHLRWLWRRCDRPDGWWARSHHADGRRKDLAFQADQQLYPMLELADFHEAAGALPTGVDWATAVGRAWAASELRVDGGLGLLASGENAADDPTDFPFIAASQILRWRTAVRLEHLAAAGALAVDPGQFSIAARSADDAFAAAFVCDANPWPYAVDAGGRTLMYHDANDLPVALAPAWGFCAADDPGWRSTMAFAFGPANPAWVSGRLPGLGSLHTPGVWTLGDLQAWISARAVGDAPKAAAALERLERIAFSDGMLPEAYDPDDETPIRHWFAWPGAALAALRLSDEHGERIASPT